MVIEEDYGVAEWAMHSTLKLFTYENKMILPNISIRQAANMDQCAEHKCHNIIVRLKAFPPWLPFWGDIPMSGQDIIFR